jgi:hypothetical protein
VKALEIHMANMVNDEKAAKLDRPEEARAPTHSDTGDGLPQNLGATRSLMKVLGNPTVFTDS